MNDQTFFNISPWNLFSEMMNADRPFNSMFRTLANRVEGRFPPVNYLTSPKAALLDIEMPGKKASDVEISLEPQAVVIEGKTKEGVSGTSYKRRFELPFPVNTEKATATFKNGILRIELPKTEQAALKRIEISTQE